MDIIQIFAKKNQMILCCIWLLIRQLKLQAGRKITATKYSHNYIYTLLMLSGAKFVTEKN